MLLPYPPTVLVLLAATLLNPVKGASPADTPADTPIADILALASSALSSGSSSDALEYYSLAIARDPSNYLTFFKRGATYLSLGRSSQASADFDKVLVLKPGFEGALTQRGKIRARLGEWDGARRDYEEAKVKGNQIAELQEAEGAALLASEAAQKKDWEACIGQSGAAIMVASQSAELRRLRAQCRLERGEVAEAVSDMQAVQKISPGGCDMEEMALQIGAMVFYGLGEREKGIEAVRACLHSDPESKKCSKLYKKMKKADKEIKKVEALLEKRTFSGAVKILTPSANGEEQGLIESVKDDAKDASTLGYLHPQVKDELSTALLETTCNAFLEMNNHKRGQTFCRTLLTLSPHSFPALLHQAQAQLDADDFEGAIATLNTAQEHHQHAAQRINPLLQKAQTLLKRSKSKDYYKILGVPRDASSKDIKRAYIKASKLNHPDKVAAGADQATRLAAEKKMAAVNEAYEVLYDEQLRARFDAGDDPNDPEAQSRGHGGPFQGSPFQGGQFQFRSGGGNPFGGGFAQQMFNNMPGGGGGGFQFHFP